MWEKIREAIVHYIKNDMKDMNADSVSQDLCPHAVGTKVAGVTFSPAHILVGNSITTEYCNRMQFVHNLGVNYWLGIASRAHRRGLQLNDLVYTYAPQGLDRCLPVVLYQPMPESFEIRLCTIHELLHLQRIDTVQELLIYLITFIAFGIYLDEHVATYVLRLSNPNQFIAARLFQGKIDAKLVTNGVSAFVPFQSYTVSDTDIYDGNRMVEAFEARELQDPEQISHLVRVQENIAANATFVDNTTDVWKAINEAKQSTLPPHYSKYLQYDPAEGHRKVGLKHFSQITEGHAITIRGGGGTHQSDYTAAQENIKRQAGMKMEHRMNKLQGSMEELKNKLAKLPFA